MGASHGLIHYIVAMTLRSRYYFYAYFTARVSEAPMTCPKHTESRCQSSDVSPGGAAVPRREDGI